MVSIQIMRIYQNISLKNHSEIQLDEKSSHHIARVMRAKIGDALTIFNGEGGEYDAVIKEINKKYVTVEMKKFVDREAESPFDLYLVQGISRGEKMDFTIQKAVELGVKKIFPILTERCNVKLDEERKEKRVDHWRAVIESACEQSGRNRVPEIFSPQPLTQFDIQADYKFILAPNAEKKLSDFRFQKNNKIIFLIGPEGGLSDNEIQFMMKKDFIPINLGPRVLRTETAALAALAMVEAIVE
jgi:16S rRNA (uracil1498-N3)-methyltransferase